MKAVFVHKSDKKVKDILPWKYRGGITPMRGYYAFLTERAVAVGEDWSKYVRKVQEIHPRGNPAGATIVMTLADNDVLRQPVCFDYIEAVGTTIPLSALTIFT